MTTQQFIDATILKATGEVNVAVFGDSESEKVRGIGNFYIGQYQDENDWDSLYTPEYDLGTVSATNTFDLDDEIRKLSDTADDTVRIDHTDGTGFTLYTIVKANELKRYYEGNRVSATGNVCAQIGRTLVFNHTFTTTDPQYGGTITAPVYGYADLLVGATDEVPVMKPNWLVLISAAEYVRNDITLQSQYPNLIKEANALMQQMKDENDNAQFSQILRSPIMGSGASW